MATDRSRSQYQALLVQDSAWGPGCLASDSSYTGLDPRPSQPTPATTSQALVLASSGTYADTTKTLTVTTQQGGIVSRSRGASFVWGDGTDTYGWDSPTVLTGFENVVWSTSDNKAHPSILTLTNGDLLTVWAQGTYENEVWTSTRTAGVWSAPVQITTSTSWSFGASPCLLRVSDDRILLLAWVSSAGSTATLRVLSSSEIGRAHV